MDQRKKIFYWTLRVSATFLFLFLTFFVARAGWFSNTPPNPPNLNAEGPVHTGSLGQIKKGGLRVNTGNDLSFDGVGLQVYGNPASTGCALNPGAGCVGIGVNSPTEKLDVLGNFKLTGIVNVNGSAGSLNQILTMTSLTTMAWADQFAWMSIQRIDMQSGGNCVSLFPACPEGWTQYGADIVFQAACSTPPTPAGWSYGHAARTCYKPF